MSGHSKWSTIKRAKGSVDAKRGALFTKLSKNISLAAKNGKDPSMNSSLRTAIEAAREANMPKDNIERAILRGAGELPGTVIEEVTYECYGPEGVAILVQCVTDNNNRTNNNIKAICSRHNGKVGTPGSVAYLFKKRGVLRVSDTAEAVQLQAMDAGVEDIINEDGGLTLYTAPNLVEAVKQQLGSIITFHDTMFIPELKVTLSAQAQQTLVELLEALADDEDVVETYHNANL